MANPVARQLPALAAAAGAAQPRRARSIWQGVLVPPELRKLTPGRQECLVPLGSQHEPRLWLTSRQQPSPSRGSSPKPVPIETYSGPGDVAEEVATVEHNLAGRTISSLIGLLATRRRRLRAWRSR
jgi:hypothetical protein